jgi:hypothetical protein
MRKLTTEQFITKAQQVHNNKYDYSKVKYINAKTKVSIICTLHGEFTQTAGDHLFNKGCPKCKGGIKFNKEQFIEKAKAIHKDKYDYGKVNYINNSTKVTIICPEHGEFQQLPREHLANKGCQKCGYANISNLKKSNTKCFITKSRLIHADKYDYSKADYKDDKTKIEIICPEHGVFLQSPTSHKQGNGCPVCAGTRKPDIINIINKANIVHANKYNYSKSLYTSHYAKIIIVCPEHGEFEQTAYNHLKGRGCPSCAVSGFQPNKPAYLYYLKVTTNNGQVLYKIGVTNRTVNERFNLTDLAKIEIVKQKLYENGQDALDWETKLKRQFKEYQYKGPDILSSGNTELFTEDIMKLYL